MGLHGVFESDIDQVIKNLVISGCSYTDDRIIPTWATYTARYLQPCTVYNFGRESAGNTYIMQSVIDCIKWHELKPGETLILVMWSGPDRQDLQVTGEYWFFLEDYTCKTNNRDPDGYWVFSGGRSNAWLDHHETKKLFQYHYVTKDPALFCEQTIRQMKLLASWLQIHGFKFHYMSFVNYWNTELESTEAGIWNLPFFCQDSQTINFDNWIFADEKHNGIYEFCAPKNLLMQDRFHPSTAGHALYTEQIIIPYLERHIL